MKEKLLPGE